MSVRLCPYVRVDGTRAWPRKEMEHASSFSCACLTNARHLLTTSYAFILAFQRVCCCGKKFSEPEEFPKELPLENGKRVLHSAPGVVAVTVFIGTCLAEQPPFIEHTHDPFFIVDLLNLLAASIHSHTFNPACVRLVCILQDLHRTDSSTST